ncbi:MAG TPA: hypothetical protein VF104_02775, partial [Burkholderiales bacterium]
MTDVVFKAGKVQSIDRSAGAGMTPATTESARGPGAGSDERLRSECASLKAQMADVAQEMRSGYS